MEYFIEENYENTEPIIEEIIEETPYSIFHKEVSRWFLKDNDLTLRLDYDLNENSRVLDIGGFKGDWASDIFSIHKCKVSIFEPVKEYYDFICNRFKKNDNFEIHDFAFGGENTFKNITISAESSSVYIPVESHKIETIAIINFNEFLDEETTVDLVKINIEGSEYDLLESIENHNIKKIKNLQIQFHIFVDDCMERKNKIREKLALTHECTYCYEFVWENWRLK